MADPLTATELRSNLYRILDEIADSGVPREIRRGDRTLLIIPADRPRFRLSRLTRRTALECSPEELVATSWESSWESDE